MANRQNTFLLKRSNVPGKVPTPGDLKLGEIAINTADAILYASGTTTNSILPIGWDRVSRTGDTVTGNFVINGGLTANTISATTYLNLPLSTGEYLPLSGGTVSGGTIFQSGLTANTIYTDYIDFNTTPTVPNPTGGTLYFDSNENALSYKPITNQNDVTVNIGQESLIRVYNDLPTTILNGQVLHITGATSGVPTVALANASKLGITFTESLAQTSGVATHDIPSGEYGFMTNFGIVRDLNTTAFTVGQEVFLSDTIDGALTNDPNNIAFTSRISTVGYCLESNATTGKILVVITNENPLQSLTQQEINVLLGNTISTGAYFYTGATTASTTTINVSPMRGWIVYNTGPTYATDPLVLNIYYSGGTNIAITGLTSSFDTYLLVNSGGTLYQTNIYPSPQERRQNIFLGRVVHPNKTTILNVEQSVDYDVSPLSSLRDLWVPIKIINEGVVPSSNGANLTFKTSSGTFWANGIGFPTDELNPNAITVPGYLPASFYYTTQTGGTFTVKTTTVDTLNYDVNGVKTLVPGSGAYTTQRIYMSQSGVIRLQYGQNYYSTLAKAIAAIPSETFVVNADNSIDCTLIGLLTVKDGTGNLSNTDDAVFTFVSKFGEILGGTAGISTTTLQQAYDNSVNPEIVTNTTLGGVQFRGGTGNDNDKNIIIENNSAVETAYIRADGESKFNTVSATTISATTYLNLPVTPSYWTSGSSGSYSVKVINNVLNSATGNYSLSEGFNTTAIGESSHAEGSTTTAFGDHSHSEGQLTIASGDSSHAGGTSSIASGEASFIHSSGSTVSGKRSAVLGGRNISGTSIDTVYVPYLNLNYTPLNDNSLTQVLVRATDGTIKYKSVSSFSGGSGNSYWSASTGTNAIVVNNSNSVASGTFALAEGGNTTAIGISSHSEGNNTTAIGIFSHAEGNATTASGSSSHAEGDGTTAQGDFSHAEGQSTMAVGLYSHAEGSTTTAIGESSHAEGQYTTAIGANGSHAEGAYTIASGVSSHAEGAYTTSGGEASHAEGVFTTAIGDYSHAEGYNTSSFGNNSHAEGQGAKATGGASHAEGEDTNAIGDTSHAEGYTTTSIGVRGSHAEGQFTIASGISSHAEGTNTTAQGDSSHSEGLNTKAIADNSHAQNRNTIASGDNSHAGGNASTASGDYSFIHSNNSIVSGDRSAVIGGQNITGTTNDTVYVPYLNLNLTPATDNSLTNFLVRGNNGDISVRSYNSINYTPNLVTVALSGGSAEFTSIKDAVDSISGASATNTYVVKVGPGVFYENTINMKSYVDVVGDSSTNTIIQANNPNLPLIIGADQSMVNNVQIQGCSGTSVSAVVYSSSTTPQLNAIFYIENVRFGKNYTHVKNIGTGGGNSIIQCSNVKYGGYPFTLGFYCTNDGSGIARMQLRNVTSTNGGVVTTSGLTFAKADKSGCGFIVNGCLLTKATGVSAGVGFHVEDGAFLRLTGVNFQRWSTGIYAPQVGSAPSIDAIALNFENCTKDVNIIHSGTTGKIQGTDNFLKTFININAPIYEVNTDPREIIVAKKGGDFASIKAAVDYLSASATTSSSSRYIISVGPGEFIENEIDLTNTPYVSIVGSNIQTTLIKSNTSSQHIIKIGINNEISFLSLSGAGAGYAGIYCYDIGDFGQAHKVSFYDCDTNIWVESNTQDTKFYGEYLDFNGEYTYGTKVIGNNSYLAIANMENYYNFPTGANIVYCNYATGSGATISTFVGDNVSNGVSGSTAFYIQDGAELNASTVTCDGFTYGFRNPSVGDPIRFDIDNASIVNGEWDLYVERVGTFGTFGGSSSHEKIFTNSTDVYWSFLDIEDGELDITRKASVTFEDGTHTDFTTLIFEGSTMGLMVGGEITTVSAFTISTAAGFGYLAKTLTPNVISRIDWVNSQITLAANENKYIYINENAILSSSGSRPDSVNNIILGRVVTNSTTVAFIDLSPAHSDHTSNRFGDLFRNALGPIYSTGSIVTENATPFRLDVTSGEYYYSTSDYMPSGGTAINFTQYYRDGLGGWVTSATTVVNNTSYDGNGSLSGLTSGYFTKHTLYVVGDGVYEKYFLVLGQNQYQTLIQAEDALLPTPPTFLTDSVAQIANIYIEQGASGITQVEDIRPVIGFKAGGVNASSVHGNLLGLGADDHTQYLLVDGSRAMSGNFNLANNNIVSAGTINGVTIESHATRHQFGGADSIGSVMPGPNYIPYADVSGRLDGWVSTGSTTVLGKVKLSVNPVSASNPIVVGENDSRFTNSFTGVSYSNNTFTFRKVNGTNVSSTFNSVTGLTVGGNLIITGNTSSNLVRITQTGSGNALLVEDSTNPDTSPFVIDSTGKVGIGLTTPSLPLHIRAAAVASTNEPIVRIQVSDSNAYLAINNAVTTDSVFVPEVLGRGDSTNSQIGIVMGAYIDSTQDVGTSPVTVFRSGLASIANVTTRPLFDFRNLSTSVMLIDANGDLGIGTSNPTSRLTVVTSSGVTGSYPANSGTLQTGEVTRLRNGGSNLVLDIGGFSSNGNWFQSTNQTDLSLTYPLLLNPNGGNVAIGLKVPTQKLHVSGNTITTGTISGATMVITSLPVSGYTSTQILMRNSTTGAIEITDSTSPSIYNYGMSYAISTFNFLT